MKTFRSLTTLAAATAITLGAVVAPTASASNVTPETVRGTAQPSEISELDIYEELQAYLPASLTRADYEASIGQNKVWDEINISEIPDSKKWLGYVAKYPDWRARIKAMYATSPSMDGRKVPVAVITKDGTFGNRPTLYMLNGAGGAEQGMDWLVSTAGKDLDPAKEGVQDLDDFYGDRDVNVVIPQGGAFSYYTDWVTSPNTSYLKGPQKWETFVTKELPGPIEEKINGNGKRAISGMSMSATSSILLAEHNPNFYDAVGSYSGCAATSSPFPYFFSNLTVQRGGGSTEQMWGPMGGEYNRYNDALINATKNNIGDTKMYVSSGSGLAGASDMASSKMAANPKLNSAQAIQGSSTTTIEGGVIEAAVSSCTHDLKAKTDSEGVDVTYNFRNTGTHSWPSWLDDINESWKVFAPALGLPETPAPVAGDGAVSAEDKAADVDVHTADQAAHADAATPAADAAVDQAAPAQ